MSDADVADALDEDSDTEFVVADAEDYNQSQRFREIHEARRDVREALKEVPQGRAPPNEHLETQNQLATRVAFYGQELAPILQKIGKWEHEFFEKHPFETVEHFVMNLGRKEGDSFDHGTPEAVSMHVYRKLNEFVREAGLGVETEDDGDEWEV